MTIANTLMILAVILGPILAVQVQKKIEAWKIKQDRKLHIFRVLMATRGTPMTPNHVEALNLIDIEFTGDNKKERAVREEWKLYLDHLCECPNDYNDPAYQAKIDSWTNKTKDCLVNMLYAMSQLLGYDFDKVQLKKGAYTPKGFADLDFEHSLMRRGLLDVIYGKRGIPIAPMKIPDRPDDQEGLVGGKK